MKCEIMTGRRIKTPAWQNDKTVKSEVMHPKIMIKKSSQDSRNGEIRTWLGWISHRQKGWVLTNNNITDMVYLRQSLNSRLRKRKQAKETNTNN